MAKILIVIPDDLDREMRKLIPAKRGEISKWITEAIREKIEREKRKKK